MKNKILLVVLIFLALGFTGMVFLLWRNLVSSGFVDEIFLADMAKVEKSAQNILEEKPRPGAVLAPILVYHSTRPDYPKETPYQKAFNVPPDVLEKEFRYLKENGYNVISLDDLAENLLRGKPLPAKPVVLTFDDGWQNQYKYAFPLLKKYGLNATFFIFTNAVGHRRFLTWPEIDEMVRVGMTIGDHTKSHPYLYKIKDEKKLRDEIIGGKEILEAHLGKKVEFFANPFGWTNDQIIKIVREAGFKAARTSYKGKYHTADEIFKLSSVQAPPNFDDFAKIFEEK